MNVSGALSVFVMKSEESHLPKLQIDGSMSFHVAARVFDDGAKAEALWYCRGLEAHMGGTEILAPLLDIARSAGHHEAPRQVFVITDGEVSPIGVI